MRKWIVTLVAALCLPAYLVAAPVRLNIAQSPAIWLETATHAARTVNYQGIFLHQYGKNIINYRLSHERAGANEIELREVLDGPVRKYYRLNNTVTVLGADGSTVALDRRNALKLFPDQLSTAVKDILVNYGIAFAGTERIAGLDAQILALTPKDDYRYPYQFWIHPKSGLLLKSVMLDKKNQPIEVFSFSSLQMHIPLDRKHLTRPKAVQVAQLPAPPLLAPDHRIAEPQIKKLPSGFHLIRQMTCVLGQGNMARQYLYSDGLVAVSVFIEPLKPKVKKGLFTHDGSYAYVKQSGVYQITVLGDVPSVTVEAFAHAFEFN